MVATQSRCDDFRDEATERAEPRAGEHPGQESEGERHEQPPLTEHEERDTHQHHTEGDETRRRLVDRVGEGEMAAQAHVVRIRR